MKAYNFAKQEEVVDEGATLLVPFAFDDRVTIDDDHSIVAVVTGYSWKAEGILTEISWVQNGDLKYVWISPTRLQLAE